MKTPSAEQRKNYDPKTSTKTPFISGVQTSVNITQSKISSFPIKFSNPFPKITSFYANVKKNDFLRHQLGYSQDQMEEHVYAFNSFEFR
ncbi:hypothetical protein AKJ49_01470 [candidate division MSBL1 archaeon SCGC-AAA382A03]|uniref:Uncharacterized protein n=1 Tax=candidate division MSBL1 archaeon SCGC-AAA382A03 TaxID=1698278 RepID=A0A133VF37_9EURY|nr:hypothetical protein AKJ49_01470 [candidate division MSBL1 archaeon SCGC-AAA382A03]